MTKPREPFFKPDSFKSLEISSHGAGQCAAIANRLVEPLLEPLLEEADYLVRLRTENAELKKKLVDVTFDWANLKAELEEAPVVYANQEHRIWSGIKAKGVDTHTARLVRVEEIKK